MPILHQPKPILLCLHYQPILDVQHIIAVTLYIDLALIRYLEFVPIHYDDSHMPVAHFVHYRNPLVH